MHAEVYLVRRREADRDRRDTPEIDPIRRAEWLAVIARDPSLVLHSEVECGCVEWVGRRVDCPVAAPSCGAGRPVTPWERPSLIFHRRGILTANIQHPAIVPKMVGIAHMLAESGASDVYAFYLGVRRGRTGGGQPPLQLGPLLRAALPALASSPQSGDDAPVRA